MVGITEAGSLISFKFPFEADSEVTEYHDYISHSKPITSFCFSFDDQYFFTGSQDGCIIIHKLSDKDSRMRREKDWIYSDEILVSRHDLLENQRVLNSLEERVQELNAESLAQLRAKDLIYFNKAEEIVAKFQAEISSLKYVY